MKLAWKIFDSDGRQARLCEYCQTYKWQDANGIYRHGPRLGARCRQRQAIARDQERRARPAPSAVGRAE